LSTKDQAIINEIIATIPNEDNAAKTISKKIYSSKYGATTTHMEKLLLRVNRGVGNPCPLIWIGKERLYKS
jgi:hypothetical protein